MPVSINDSFLTETARDYAVLSDLAYAEWRYSNGEWVLKEDQNDFNYYNKLWGIMHDKDYRVIHYQPDLTDKSAQGTPTDSGYSGTLFSYQGKMILANRGSALINPSDSGDLEADKQIFARQLPTEQFLSMMAYINELKTIYQINLGTFDVTGHSLGGCLAQIAKAALSSEIDTVYTYNAPGAMNLTQEYFKEEGAGKPGKVTVKHWVGDPFSPIGFWQSSEWDVAAWNAYEAFFAQRAGLDDGKVFNVSGKDFVSPIADFGKDIGPEVFIDGSTHRIWHVQENLNNGRFFVDNRKPVTIIGSAQNESFFGDYSSGHYSGYAPARVTMVGGYGDDYLGGGSGNDELYGDLPREFDQAAIAKSGNVAGIPGNDILDGGKGDDVLYGGPGDDTYYIDYGDGKDKIVDTEGNNKIIYGKQGGAKSALQKFYAPEGGTSFWVTADGAIRFEQSSAQQIVLPDGGTIVFQDSQASAFGIRLIDLPELPSRGQTILGTSASEIMAYSTEGDDLINGMAGDDDICARMGGNDWILGGEGSDIVVSYNTNGGNDILEGGSGADLLAGGPGDDMVFAEVYGGMVDLILAGESAPAGSGKGEMLSGGSGDDYVYGSNRGDALFGGEGHDLIVGGGGDDAIFGDYDSAVSTRNWSFTIEKGTGVSFTDLLLERNTFQGDDTIYAGTGNDFVYAGGGSDEIYGGEGDDTIAGEGGDDFITGDAGNDFLDGDAPWVAIEDQGDDYIDGGAGDDRIWGQGGSDDLFGGEGKDTIYGGDGNDYMDGGAGDDTLYGGPGNDTMYGSDGGDWLQGDEGDDTLDGGPGEDTLVGGEGNDTLFGGDDKDHLQADAGDDYIDGGAGDDELMGGAGNDELYGGDGNDTIWGGDTPADGGNDYIEGGAGNDTIYGMAGDDQIWGDEGNDRIQGDDGNDFLDGGEGDDVLYGGGGVDTLYGGEGNDSLYGEAGDDYLVGGAGNDYLRGGSGNDTYFWGKGYGNDTIDNYGDYTPAGYLNGIDSLVFGEGLTAASFEFSAAGPYASDLVIRIKETGETLTLKDWLDALPDRLNTFQFADGTGLTAADIEQSGLTSRGTEGNDIMMALYNRRENFFGLAGDDTLRGANLEDRLDGGDGNDTLYGGDGNDILAGGSGNDVLYGEAGNDVLLGGPGDDQLRGGKGNDTYLFGKGSGNDVIFSEDIYSDGGIYTNGDDLVVMGEGLSKESFEFLATGPNNKDLVLRIKETGETLSMREWADGWWDQVDRIMFADGTVLTPTDISRLSIAIKGTEGSDTLVPWFDQKMTLYGLGGDDTLSGSNKDVVLDGGAGNDQVTGGSGNDQLLGGEGDDWIVGGSGNDVITGGPGADQLTGGAGSDIYRYAIGDGSDIIYRDESDIVEFGPGITADSIELLGGGSNDNRTLVFRFKDTGETVRLVYPYDGSSYNDDTFKMQHIRFADGTEMTPASFANRWVKSVGTDDPELISGFDNVKNEMNGLGGNDYLYGKSLDDTLAGGTGNDYLFGADGNDTLTGGDGDDSIYGAAGNDILAGGPGSDVLDGGAGIDTYRFAKGDGYDTISATGEDILEFGAGISPDSVEFIKSGSSALTLQIRETGDQIYFGQWFVSDAYKVGRMKFADGTEWTLADIKNRPFTIIGTEANNTLTGYASSGNAIYGLGGNDTINGKELDDRLDGGAGADTIKGWRGNDTIIGGAGIDKLYGESGSDTYLFGKGHGRDTLQDLNEKAGSTDIVKLEGFTKKEIIFSRSRNDLLILTSKDDSITSTNNLLSSVKYTSTQTGTFTDLSPGIERVETSDGYYITRADIIKIINAMVSYNISDTMAMSTQYTNFLNNTKYQTMLTQSWQQVTNP